MAYYLAYGSNLDKHQMRRRCPGARPIGPVMLHDAKLVFRGVADVEYAPGAVVPLGLWRITRGDEHALDRYEGVGGGYYTKEELTLANGKPAFIYLMTGPHARGIYPPSQGYAEGIAAGYRDFGMDLRYLRAAIAESYAGKEPTDLIMARRKRLRAGGPRGALVRMPEHIAIKKVQESANELARD